MSAVRQIRLTDEPGTYGGPGPLRDDTSDAANAKQARINDLFVLHDAAETKCRSLTVEVVELIRRHVNTPVFTHDIGLVGGGVYYAAAYISVREPGLTSSLHALTSLTISLSSLQSDSSDENFRYCIAALKNMRWTFSDGSSLAESLVNLRESRLAKAEASSSTAPDRRASFDTSRPSTAHMDRLMYVPPSYSARHPSLRSTDMDIDRHHHQPQRLGSSGSGSSSTSASNAMPRLPPLHSLIQQLRSPSSSGSLSTSLSNEAYDTYHGGSSPPHYK